MQREASRDDREIVTAVREALSARIGPARFALWFGRGVKLLVAGGLLQVEAGESFRLDYLRRTFRADVALCSQQVLGPEAGVEFVLNADLAPATAADSAADEPASVAMSAATESVASQPAVADEPQTSRPPKRQFASLSEFVVGPGSQVAFAAAQGVATQPGMYSPLTLVGPPGCGKTHLLEGIWRHVRTSATLRRVIYLSAEQFTNQFLEALKHSGTPNFRRKYRDVELLLIDDVQFFAGKQSTVVELVHTVDTLLRDGRQVVFAADRPPAELRGIGPELVARLTGGLVCTLRPADAESRLKILEQLAAKQSVPLGGDVLSWLAGQLAGDVRHLIGAVNRLVASSQALDRPVNLEFAQTALDDLVHAARRPVRVPEILDAVCDVFGVGAAELQSSSKSPAVALPRMLVMFLARKYTRAALSEIGRVLGRRSHSTVVSGQHKVNEWLLAGKRVALGHSQCTLEEAVRRVESHLRLA
jgi:chromosomal replication initiator protein